MKPSTRRFHDLLANVYVAFFGSLASIIALVWFAAEKLAPWTIIWIILVPASAAVLLGIGVYSIRVRQENKQFRNFMKTLHRINHDYRDALTSVFKNLSPEITDEEFLNHVKQIERKTLKSVCQRLAKTYTSFVHSECTVTIKLITRSGDKTHCETYERSEENCERDAGQPRQFEIDTGENTAFDRALMYAPGNVSHFYSADLSKDKHYRNQRDHWEDFYLSAIVVPIRSINAVKIGNKDGKDDIGFLCVDTPSKNRLNNTWHVELLAAFADQMYNFVSLMRGNYVLKKQTAPAVVQPPVARSTS